MNTSHCQEWVIVYLWTVFNIIQVCRGQNYCANGAATSFAKVSSAIPRLTVQPILLYATSAGTAITAECYNRCQASDDCAGFIVDYERASCFRVPKSDSPLDEYVPAKSTNFFQKTCLQVPANCTKKAWPLEFAPNSELVGYQQHVVPNVANLWQCAQLCVMGTTQYRYDQQMPCYSAQFHRWSGTCTLNTENRRTKPEAFNPSVQNGIDYVENLCIADAGVDNAVCWHEPIYNYTIVEVDLQIPNIDLNQCRERCETEQYFTCRGYTYKCSSTSGPYYGSDSICYLHSDDSATAGPLVPTFCATYVERLTCIDLRVECSTNSMIVSLHYKNFNGRMFVAGYSEECGVNGHNEDVTTLVLPTSSNALEASKCGIFVAHAITDYKNRKLASSVIVIQRHPIIQTLGDRIVKVSCIIDENGDRLPRPLFNNITLDASFGVAEPPIQTSIIHELKNTTSVSPAARLRILDVRKGGSEASETVLGDELELRIDIYPPFNASILRAGHLVASSGDERDSLLLLDWRGCPPDPSTFPALTAHGSNTLSAIFKAFRFPSSPVLKFSLILTICDGICQPTDCGNGLLSWGRRRKRSIDGKGNAKTQEVPLQLVIIVRSPIESRIEDTNEVASKYSMEDDDKNERASWSRIVSFLLVFGLAQILLLAIGCYLYYKKKTKNGTPQITLQPRKIFTIDR